MHHRQVLLYSVREGSQELPLMTWQTERGSPAGVLERAVLRRSPLRLFLGCFFPTDLIECLALSRGGSAPLEDCALLCTTVLSSCGLSFWMLYLFIFEWLQVALEVRRKMPTLKIRSQSSPCTQLVPVLSSLPHAAGVHNLLWNEKLCVSHRFDVCFPLSHLAGAYWRLHSMKLAWKESLWIWGKCHLVP